MVLDNAIAALGGALVGGVVTGVSNWYITRQMIEAENDRRRADYLLQQEADALMKVFESLQQIRRAIGRARQEPPLDEFTFKEEVEPAYEEYWSAYKQATVFLEDSQRGILKDTWVEFSTKYEVMAQMTKAGTADYEPLDWSGFIDTIEQAEEMLETAINRPIRNFESA